MQTIEITQHRLFVQFKIGREFGNVHLVRNVFGQKEQQGLDFARVGCFYSAKLRQFLVDDEIDDSEFDPSKDYENEND